MSYVEDDKRISKYYTSGAPLKALTDFTDADGVALTNIGTALRGWNIKNLDATTAYIQFFNNKASAVTLGTTTPDWVLPIAASAEIWQILSQDDGIGFGKGLSMAVTTTRDGSTLVTTGIQGNFFYKRNYAM